MLDIYVPEGTISEDNVVLLLARLTEALLRWTDATQIPVARDNAGAFLHVFPPTHVTAGGKAANVVRIDVKIPEVVLSTIEHTWITIANTVDGGWGIDGHGLSNAELDEL